MPQVNPSVSTAPASRPQRLRLDGRYAALEPLDAFSHAESLWTALAGAANYGLFSYLFDGPFPDRAEFDAALAKKAATEDPLFFAIVDRAAGRAVGYASYMRIDPAH